MPVLNFNSVVFSICWLIRISQLLRWQTQRILGQVFGSFMISRPNLGYSHWLEFVYTKNAAITSFYNVTRQHLD